MKFFHIILLLHFNFLIYGQDIIVKTDGEVINTKIIEILNNDINYKKSDKLGGAIYSISKSEIAMITFENGTYEPKKSSQNHGKINIEFIKETIIENINKYTSMKNGLHNYHASFEGNYLKLSRVMRDSELHPNYKLYDFSAVCIFHILSIRKQGISYINVNVPKMKNNKVVSIDKLVLKVRGHENAEVLLNALKSFNKKFNQ